MFNFQFRYGAIETLKFLICEVDRLFFQFRYGAIETYQPHRRIDRPQLLSIPLWCD